MGSLGGILVIVLLCAAVGFIGSGVYRFSAKTPQSFKQGVRHIGCALALIAAGFFFMPGMLYRGWMLLAIVLGIAATLWMCRAITSADTAKFMALFSGAGGAAVALVTAVVFVDDVDGHLPALVSMAGALGTIAGCFAVAGGFIVYQRLGRPSVKAWRAPAYGTTLFFVALMTTGIGFTLSVAQPASIGGVLFFLLLALVLGYIILAGIREKDLPLLPTLLIVLTGFAATMSGVLLDNIVLIAGGAIAGSMAFRLLCTQAEVQGSSLRAFAWSLYSDKKFDDMQPAILALEVQKTLTPGRAADILAQARSVFIVPGSGMTGAQHAVWQLAQYLEQKGKTVRFAVHPVAGRMPNHMAALLRDAGVPYDRVFELEEINQDFSQADIALVIGANDVINPAARTDEAGPLSGMPVLNADRAGLMIVIKRGEGRGYAGVDNLLLRKSNCYILHEDAQKAVEAILAALQSA